MQHNIGSTRLDAQLGLDRSSARHEGIGSRGGGHDVGPKHRRTHQLAGDEYLSVVVGRNGGAGVLVAPVCAVNRLLKEEIALRRDREQPGAGAAAGIIWIVKSIADHERVAAAIND